MELNDVQKGPRLYTPKEVAAFIGISYATLFRLVKGGKIKAVNIAKTGTRPLYAFAAEDVQTYFNSLPNPPHRAQGIDE